MISLPDTLRCTPPQTPQVMCTHPTRVRTALSADNTLSHDCPFCLHHRWRRACWYCAFVCCVRFGSTVHALQATGRVQLNMRLVAVNDTQCQGLPKKQVAAMLKGSNHGDVCILDLLPELPDVRIEHTGTPSRMVPRGWLLTHLRLALAFCAVCVCPLLGFKGQRYRCSRRCRCYKQRGDEQGRPRGLREAATFSRSRVYNKRRNQLKGQAKILD